MKGLTEEQLLRCADCHSSMRRVEEIQHPTVHCRFLELYQCTSDTCQRKLVIQWERPDGQLTEDDLTWVEREVLNKGHWFPQSEGGFGSLS